MSDTAEQRKSDTLGYAYAAAGAVLFSTKAVIVKLAYGLNVDAETLLALRMGFSLPSYLAIGWLGLRNRRRPLASLPSARLMLRAAGVGMLGYWIASYTDFLGLEYITAQFERLILFTYPLFVVLFGALFFGQKVRPRALLALVVSYAGLAVVFGENFSLGGRDVAVGAAWVLAAAVAFALYQLLAKVVITEMGPRLFTCVAMTGASAAAFAQFFVTNAPGDLIASPAVLVYACIIAVASTVLPSFFMNAALHRISAQANATIGTLSPIATILLAALVLGERLSAAGLIGAALVLAGVGWFTLAER